MLEISAWGHGQAFGPLFIERELGVPEDEVARWTGILAAAPLLVAAPLAPFWGVLGDRYSRKMIVLRCFLAAAVGYVLAMLAQSVWQYLGIRLLLGLTFGSNAIIVAILATVVPHRHLGLTIGITQMVFPIGNSIGPLFGSALIEWFGLRGMFAIDALIAFSSFLMVVLLYREPPRRQDTSQGIFRRLGTVAGVVWRERPIRLTFVLFFLFAGGWGLVTPFMPLLIARVYHGENVATVIGLILAGYGALAAIAAPVAGRLADRLGPTRLTTANTAALALMSLGLVFANTPLQVALFMLLGAIPFGANNTVLYAHLARHTPREHLTAIMSLSPMARNIAMLVGPLVGAAVAGLGLQAVFAVAVALYLVAVGVSLALVRLSSAAPAYTLRADSAES